MMVLIQFEIRESMAAPTVTTDLHRGWRMSSAVVKNGHRKYSEPLRFIEFYFLKKDKFLFCSSLSNYPSYPNSFFQAIQFY